MTFRAQAVAVLAVLGLADAVQAQPVPPARPTYSPYSSILRPGGGGTYYGFGFNQGDSAALVQNQLLAQQINQTSQQIQGLQTFLATGINPNLGITGRGATFNNLGHWYPSARNGGGGGGMMGGGLVSPNRPLMGIGNNALRTAALGAGVGSALGSGGPFGSGGTTPKGTATVPNK